MNDQSLRFLNHAAAVNIFRNLENGPIRLTFRRPGFLRRLETQRQDHTSTPSSSFLHSTPITPSSSSAAGSYYSLISPTRFKSSKESNSSTPTASLTLSRSDVNWRKLNDSMRMSGRKCPRVKTCNSYGRHDSSNSFFTQHNSNRFLFASHVEKQEDRNLPLPVDDSNDRNDDQNINYMMKVILFSLIRKHA